MTTKQIISVALGEQFVVDYDPEDDFISISYQVKYAGDFEWLAYTVEVESLRLLSGG